MKKEYNEDESRITIKIQTVGVIVVVTICILLFTANILISSISKMDKAIINFDYFAIMFLYFSFVCFYSFAKFKNIYHLIIGIGFCLTFICMIVLHFFYLVT